MRNIIRAVFAVAHPSGFRYLHREDKHALVSAITLVLITGGATALVLSSGTLPASISEALLRP